MGLTNEQLLKRSKLICGSDIVKLMGLSRYGDSMSVYNDKKGISPELKGDHLDIGNALEPVLANWFKDVMGGEMIEVKETKIHKDFEFAGGNEDYIYIDDNGNEFVVDCKTTGFTSNYSWYEDDWGEEFTDMVPVDVLCQINWYVGIENSNRAKSKQMSHGYVAAWLANHGKKIYKIDYDEEFFLHCIEVAREFYNKYIISDNIPEFTGKSADKVFIDNKYNHKENNGIIAVADPESEKLAIKYKESIEKLSNALEEKTRIRNLIIDKIGFDDGIESDIFKATNKFTSSVNYKSVCEEIGYTKEQAMEYVDYYKLYKNISSGYRGKKKLVDSHSRKTNNKKFYLKLKEV